MFHLNDPLEAQPIAAAKFKAKLLTYRRIKIISSFLSMTINNPFLYGEFESTKWMDMLIELLCEPKRCKSTRADIKAWLKNDYFDGLINQVREVTEKIRLSMANSGSESPGSSSSTGAAVPVPMDLSVGQSSSGMDEESDSMGDVYTPNLNPMDAVENLANEELGTQNQHGYWDLIFPRSEAVFSQGSLGAMAANQNLGVGLPGTSFGQQRFHVSHDANPRFAIQNEVWKPSTEDWRTLDRFSLGTAKEREETRPDNVFQEPPAVAPWLFNGQNLSLENMETENEDFMQATQTACLVQVKTEVEESDPESELLDISYTGSATGGQEAANPGQFQAPQYQPMEGFNWQMSMSVPVSPQSSYEGQDGNQYVMDQVGDHFAMGQEEALDYSINKHVRVPLEGMPKMATAPLSPNYEDKWTQTLPVPNQQLARQLPMNFSKSTDLLSDCNKVLTGMVENMPHSGGFSNGWDVVYRALSLCQATLKNKQQ